MFKAGQKIGSYSLVERLRRGGFGEVWLADWETKFATTKVAVKNLSRKLASSLFDNIPNLVPDV